MAHITVPEGLPGIVGPLTFSPETAKPLLELAEVLLRGRNTLSSADRETIATYVSSQNECRFCQLSHGAAAAEQLSGNYELIDQVEATSQLADISEKLKALLAIAGKVQKGGKHVSGQDVDRARRLGATDREIHLYGADRRRLPTRSTATWMAWDPTGRSASLPREMGQRMARVGYVRANREEPVHSANLRAGGD